MPTFLPLALLLALAPQTTPTGVAIPADLDLLALVPADAISVVATDRLDAIRERAAQNAWGRFLADERIGIAPGVERTLEEAEETEALLRAWRAIDGRVVAYAMPGAGDEELAVVVLIDAGARGAEVSPIVDELVRRAGGGTAVASERSHAGIALATCDRVDGDGSAVRFQVDRIVGVAVGERMEDTLAVAHAAIDRALGSGAGATFAADAGFAAARALGTSHEPALALHVRLPELLAALDKDWAEDEDDRRTIRAIGLDRIEWLHLEADLGAGEELHVALRAHVPAATFLDRLTAAFGPLPLDLLRRLPGESTGITLAGFDVPALWTAVRGLARDLGPEAEAEFEEALAEMESGAGAEIEDLLSMITGQVAGFQMLVPVEEMPELAMLGEDADPAMAVGGAFLVGVPDSDPVRDLVARALAKVGMDGMVEQKTVAGIPTAVMSFGGMFEVRWAFLEDAIAISRFQTPFRTLLERGGRTDGSAAADPGFVRETRAYSGACYLTVNDTATSVRSLLAVAPLASFFLGGGMDLPDVAVLRSPPDPAIAAEYFRGKTTSAFRRHGASFEMVIRAR